MNKFLFFLEVFMCRVAVYLLKTKNSNLNAFMNPSRLLYTPYSKVLNLLFMKDNFFLFYNFFSNLINPTALQQNTAANNGFFLWALATKIFFISQVIPKDYQSCPTFIYTSENFLWSLRFAYPQQQKSR